MLFLSLPDSFWGIHYSASFCTVHAHSFQVRYRPKKKTAYLLFSNGKHQTSLESMERRNEPKNHKITCNYPNNIYIYVYNTEDQILTKTKDITGTRSTVFSFSF